MLDSFTSFCSHKLVLYSSGNYYCIMVFPTFIAGAKIRKKSEHHKKVEKISLKTSQRSTTRLTVRIFYKYLFDSFLWVLGWDKVVSGTWARHSFATNLKLASVEELYISESMGHSQGNDVTSGYQDMYPLEIRFRNNCKLLNIRKC